MIHVNRTVVLFMIATLSLLAGGMFLRNNWSWEEFAAMAYIGTCGTILVYGINLAKFTYAHYLSILKASIRKPVQGIFLLQMIPAVPWAVKHTTPFGIVVFLIVFGCGLLYALQVKLAGKYFQVKRFAVLKNTFIGFAWGALILVGAGTWDNDLVRMIFLFVSLQILNGSVIRDVSDIELDRQQGVRTLPVLCGTKVTFRILHAINLLTVLCLFLVPFEMKTNIFICTIVAWKGMILWMSQKHPSRLWKQDLNILTCSLIGGLLYILEL
jgi:4-hydroxybenzoate polyprenyltransferase